jgi:putative protease
MIELLSPVGDLDCLKAAVQNGADCVYFGASNFSARAFASNFDDLELAINYAKIRGVKTNLTLNTLIKNDEFEDAYNLAKKAYELGIDAIIVQDLGLATRLIKDFPDLPIHASTQMSIHNLQGTLKLQNLGFKRVVLARELCANEIEYICQNSNVEIECFIHGALCISYSGQCLFSSLVGGRSGNRGKCAQPCRLPYELVQNGNETIDKGFLLSTKDLCGLDYIPFLINAGVTSFKIEGRMKTPEYVATVTRIYRKYIDLALSGNPYVIDEKDKKDLLQVFNRGLSSNGHLDKEPNKNLIYPIKPNNMGLPLGIIQKYNKTKGHITLKLQEELCVGDCISTQKENGSYNVSELMVKNKNIKIGNIGNLVTIGRMKGNISVGDKVYKISSKVLKDNALNSFKTENRKIPLNIKLFIQNNKNISAVVNSCSKYDLYKNLNFEYTSNIIPNTSINKPLDKDTIIKQFSKTNNSIYEFKKIEIILDDNLFLPISSLNDLRRTILENIEKQTLDKIKRTSNCCYTPIVSNASNLKNNYKISLLLNDLNLEYDYSKLDGVHNLYIPLKFFVNKNYENILNVLNKKFSTYIYLPTIIRANYRNLFYDNIVNTTKKYNIKGIVLSNISNFMLISDLYKSNKNLELIANYTFNIYNNETINKLNDLQISKYIVSPELDKLSILNLYGNPQKELIVYGKIPLMNMNYCLLGKSNKCYPNCNSLCTNKNRYFLKDRLGLHFDIVPDNIQTVTTIYNCKTLSICPTDFNLDCARIDILYENIDEINNIINTVKLGKKFEGKQYTNGNLNREI